MLCHLEIAYYDSNLFITRLLCMFYELPFFFDTQDGFTIPYTNGRSYHTQTFDYNGDGLSVSDNSCDLSTATNACTRSTLTIDLEYLGIAPDGNAAVINTEQTQVMQILDGLSIEKVAQSTSLRLPLTDEGKTAVHVFKYTVADQSSNEVSCYRTITVSDRIVPTVTCPLDVTVPTDDGLHTSTVYIPQYPYKPRPPHIRHELGHVWIDDNSILAGGEIGVTAVATKTNIPGPTGPVPDVRDCSTPLTAAQCTFYDVLPVSEEMFELQNTDGTSGVNHVRYVATDPDGNVNDCQTVVTVVDEEKPYMVCPRDIVLSADDGTSDISCVIGGSAGASAGNCKKGEFYASHQLVRQLI